MSVVGGDPTRRALTALPLPRAMLLSPTQLRGAGCVWCDSELHGDTAQDLGQRYESILGVVGRWFPRGCRACTLKATLAQYKAHPGACKECVDDPTRCEVRRGLRALALELRP
ncbi:hypothetical protein [Streptomyces sp. NPDC046805]|uniref:hypothetical protein n=1 Tax=Streptomyces sp. NPDC046805 TaxID=3155134 RepID=UPI0033E50D94